MRMDLDATRARGRRPTRPVTAGSTAGGSRDRRPIGWGAATAIAVLLVGGAGLPACGSEDSGILVEVSAPAASSDFPQITRLRFVVGTQVAADPVRVYAQEPSSPIDVDVGGRDLARRPYRLLFRDGLTEDRPVVVGVVAEIDGHPVAFAGTPPRAFRSGRVLLERVVLDPQTSIELGGCVSWVIGDEVIAVGAPDDQDCDGHLAGTEPGLDCDDRDPGVKPGALEICGDGIDQDCDGDATDGDGDGDKFGVCAGDCADSDPKVHPYAHELCDLVDQDCDGSKEFASACYDRATTAECFLGAASCSTTTQGPAMTCGPTTLDHTLEPVLCERYEACLSSSPADAWRCANPATHSCTLAVAGDGRVCAGSEPLPKPANVTSETGCTFKLAGPTGEYGVRISSSAANCLDSTLHVISSSNQVAPQVEYIVVLSGGPGPTGETPLASLVYELFPQPAPDGVCPAEGDALVCTPVVR